MCRFLPTSSPVLSSKTGSSPLSLPEVLRFALAFLLGATPPCFGRDAALVFAASGSCCDFVVTTDKVVVVAEEFLLLVTGDTLPTVKVELDELDELDEVDEFATGKLIFTPWVFSSSVFVSGTS